MQYFDIEIIYISTGVDPKTNLDNLDPQAILYPYLQEALQATSWKEDIDRPLFEVFYSFSSNNNVKSNDGIFKTSYPSSHFALRADYASDYALLLFQDITKVFSTVSNITTMWPEIEVDNLED